MPRTPLALLTVIAAAGLAAVGLAPGAPTPAPAARQAAVAAAFARLSTPSLGQLGQQPAPDLQMLQRSGIPPANAFRDMAAAAAALPTVGRAWSLKGPTNVGGRILDMVVDPRTPNTVFAGTASGGVWVSHDAGSTYAPAWPQDNVQTIGAMAIDSRGTLWVGTGEAGPGGGSLTYGGDGVYKSSDAGATWTKVGLSLTERIGRVVVDPTDDSTVWVAANGPLYRNDGERGLYVTHDAGATWIRALAGANATTGAVDVAIDPKNPNVMLTAMWDRIRNTGDRQYNGTGSGVYRSTDRGRTWTAIVFPTLGVNNPGLGRIGVAFSPSDPTVAYALSSTIDGLTAGFYSSSDSGATFLPKPPSTSLVTGGFVYAWWFGRVYVDPANPLHVYATGVNLSQSNDGGTTFGGVGGSPHSDHHALVWDPVVKNRVYLGNDGGSWTSVDNGATFKHGTVMPWNQPFSVDVSQTRPERIMAGLQDNGGNRSYGKDGVAGPNRYNDWTGGDGTEMRINPKNDLITYGCSQYGACAVSKDGGNTSSSFGDSIQGDRKNWLTPIEFDPANPSIVYTGSSILHKSTDDAANWTPISPDLTNGETGSTETNPLFRNYDTITSIAPAAGGQTIYVGTDDGHVQYTHSGGGLSPLAWTDAKQEDLPHDWVSRVRVDPRNANVAWVSYSAFRAGSQRAILWRTTDGGVSWRNLSGNLPPGPLNDVLLVGDQVFVGGDAGVFTATVPVTQTALPAWSRLGSQLPNSPIWDLAYQRATNTVYAGDFGHGVYAVSLDAAGMTPAVVTRPATTVKTTRSTRHTTSVTPAGGSLAATGLPVSLVLAGGLAVGAGLGLRRRRA